ncbi:MAG TPA: NrfD/PsrC family molybdoenzyme membrane anchor subunit [Herpetosiphonaceae bacterium]|nr:NrfD/PsrC family molybdoenzyme membrane anchor subunit [Herpetosiphonaceae bacterium]
MEPLIVGDPHWRWYIVFYFFLGGLAAGIAFVGALAALFGQNRLKPIVRLSALVPLPLALICTVILIVDLSRPERFWHMMIQSETWLPMFKYWSPMSYGSWILLVFSALSFLNFVAALWGDRPGLLQFLPRLIGGGITGTLFQILMLVFSYGLASYTGALLNATNQLFWSDTPLMGALFFVSAVGTGISTLLLLVLWRRRAGHAVVADLEAADNWAMGLELLVIAGMFISLGTLAGNLLGSIYGITLIVGTVLLGLLIPLLLHARPLLGHASPLVAAVLALGGGFALRWAIVMAAQGVYVYGR